MARSRSITVGLVAVGLLIGAGRLLASQRPRHQVGLTSGMILSVHGRDRRVPHP